MAMYSLQGTVLRLCAAALLLAGAVWQLHFSLQAQRDFTERAGSTVRPESRNLHALTYEAKQKYMLEADLAGAQPLLRQALTVNPLHVPAWLSLAEVYNDLGEKETASAILEYADQLTTGLKRWRWEKALTAYQLGKMAMLPEELRFIIREIPGKNRTDALQLAFTLWDQPDELLTRIGRENLNHLLGHAVRTNQPEMALFFWAVLESSDLFWQPKEALALIDMLIRVEQLPAAAQIWRKHFNPEQLLFNGDFSQPFLKRAFGWRLGKQQNYDLKLIEEPPGGPTKTLHYRFKGWDNINFSHLSQIVPLTGGKTYLLSAEMKSQKITTNQRPYLEVVGYKCTIPAASSEMVAADQEWTRHLVAFVIPEECSAVLVRLRRKESNHIDSKLAGQLWLRKVAMAETENVAWPEHFPAPQP
jgi:tetratricopeptide (TPR) repeat protein